MEERETARKWIEQGNYHHDLRAASNDLEKIALVGSPNVGKSVIFNNLTGRYVIVSNYPGTTVEVTRGKGRLSGEEIELIDTPGMYSLLPITEEERISMSVLLDERPGIVILVADARNIERMLHLTLQIIEAELSVILDLNLMDEAERLGVTIDLDLLEKQLGVPVVGTVATEHRGMDLLKERIVNYDKNPRITITYGESLERDLQKLENLLWGEYYISKRAVALLLIQDDPVIRARVKEQMGRDWILVDEIVEDIKKEYSKPLNYLITLARQMEIEKLLAKVVTFSPAAAKALDFRERLSRLMMHPIYGIPILLLAIYGIYEFVGVFGAQVSVDFLENKIFGEYINPFAVGIISSVIPWKTLQELFVGQYGIITLGIRYATAIILPIVITFFIAFSLLEDTGYLPRLAMLLDRLFKKIGLNGRAVIPIVLGFGCDTIGTMVTRTLETKRERIIATLLLALAVPCSAQIGVILALLAGTVKGLVIFTAIIATVFVFVGLLASKVMPGQRPLFYMEISPLRWPKLSNIVTKTYTRAEWYFKEVLPLFVLASILIWVGRITGVFELVLKALLYPVTWIGLPKEAAAIYLYGFFRRDFGAAGLYDLKAAGILSGIPLLVSVVTLALFMPCIAQFSMTIKERGIKMAVGMAAFIFPFAFFVGGLLNHVLVLLGVKL